MDFIERLFGISPDGGNGMTEAMFVAAIAAIVVLAVYRRRRSQPKRP